jgi:tRNA A-37 threonylcarbamoyl transferase component Bud32
MVETNSGMWLDQTLRAGAVGTWWSAATANGQPMGLLQLEPSLVAEPGSRDRLAAAVTAVRTVNSRGVLRTTELVVDAKRSWLVVATRPTPTLSDLLAAAPSLAPGAAAGVAVDVGQALRDLHAVGLSHGDLCADTVVLTSGGGATLVEVGVLAAVRGLPSDVGRDLVAWAALTRSLAAVATTSEAELLRAAAATAESGDLAYAVRRLAHEAASLADFVARESLVDALPSVKPATPGIPRSRSTMDQPASSVRLRFGRGVPLTAPATSRAAPSRPPRRRWLRAAWTAAIVALLMLGVGAVLWWQLLLPE